MSNNELPNLSTWHRVPIGATIPAGTPYAYVYGDCFTVDLGGYPSAVTVYDNYYPHYTEHPITRPLPTEDGATIVVSRDKLPPNILLTREGGRWIDCDGDKWVFDQITSWAPVTVGETVVMP